jgi:predicted PurR-regulated permease PerM
MIGSSVKLLPVRDKYVIQLVEEFEEVARAVIVSTIVGAVLQGFFGAIGFYLSGMQSVFLLILLTMLTSMIPIIGAAPVWFGAAAWLYFNGKIGPAIMLAVYGLAVMLMVDNVVRPLVLHGRSKLHPLLGLLSVLGGVQLLAPIGVFIGPMAVAFLQAGLNMFHSELVAIEKQKKAQQAT